MNVYDIIIGIVLLLAIIEGWRRGIITQLCTLAGILIGVWAAFRFSNRVGTWIGYEQLSPTVSFIVLFIVAVLIALLVGWLMRKVIDAAGLGIWNRLGGVVVSIVVNCLILNLALNLFFTIDRQIDNKGTTKAEQSLLLAPLQKFSSTVMPYLTSIGEFAIDQGKNLFNNHSDDGDSDSSDKSDDSIHSI